MGKSEPRIMKRRELDNYRMRMTKKGKDPRMWTRFNPGENGLETKDEGGSIPRRKKMGWKPRMRADLQPGERKWDGNQDKDGSLPRKKKMGGKPG